MISTDSIQQTATDALTGKALTTSGNLFKTLRLRDEGYEFIDDPQQAIAQVKLRYPTAALFTFTQKLSETSLKYSYYSEFDSLAVLSISTYETWWKKQINDKTRNMVRKAEKKGVTIRVTEFNDQLVSGIESIHNEHPLRQGKPFKHYGKPFDVVKRDHSSFLDRSEFIGAYIGDELIGIVKLVHQGEWSSLMQIISKVSHREKAPTNALLAKAVEICAAKGIGLLQYGQWSIRGIGDFKLHHGFHRVEVPRYFVPVNAKGRLMLQCKLHRSPAGLIPSGLMNFVMDMRSKWYHFKFRNYNSKGQ